MSKTPTVESRSWDAQLADHLDEVMIDEPLETDSAGQVIDLVGRYGFAILNAPPPAATDDARAIQAAALASFGTALGTPVAQSPRQEMVEDVRDYSATEIDDRGYRSAGEITPHSDPPTLIVLHCLQPAKSGGESSLVSVNSIVQAMESKGPELVAELFAPLPGWQVAGQYGEAEQGPARPRPVLARHRGVLSCVLYRPFIERGAASGGHPLTERQIEALDEFERLSADPSLTLRFTLGAGQTLVLHNRSVLHARTDFSDWDDHHHHHHHHHHRRHLLRMWIDAPDAFPVHPAHELGDIFAPATNRAGNRPSGESDHRRPA